MIHEAIKVSETLEKNKPAVSRSADQETESGKRRFRNPLDDTDEGGTSNMWPLNYRNNCDIIHHPSFIFTSE